ncbi:hypothetical protein [Noviherbaspirillum massiliense]|uniref:hypothetical protein n=1 Tax=Noviherbaspirillum massiliense TaxID=1465823 RepID=UPI0002FB6FA1|nr:hypothetical protein [Noviherbaspirillum massiliense]
MTPEEIAADINSKNRQMLYARKDYQNLSHQQVLALMDAAAMQGFRIGSNIALSMMKGAMLVRTTKNMGAKTGM